MRIRCFVRKCVRPVERQGFICLHHWLDIPEELRLELYDHFKPGQGVRVRPSWEWFQAADRALKRVEERLTQLHGKGART